MRIGGSLMLIAVGAVLKFGVTAQVRGLALGTIGVVLMIVGVVAVLLSLTMLSTRRRTDVVYGPNSVSYIEPDPAADRYFV